MALQVIGTRKCRETQKTERYFKERNISYHFVDISERPLSTGELKSIIQAVGLDRLIDTESKIYKKKGMAYMEFDPAEEISEEPLLMKTPVIRNGSRAVVGFDPGAWKDIIGEK